MLSQSTLEFIIENTLQVKGHQRRTKSGKLVTVNPFQRKGEKKLESASAPREPKLTAEWDKEAQKGIEEGKQTQLTGKGKVKKENLLTKKASESEFFEMTPEAETLMNEYNRILDLMEVLVESYESIDEAEQDPLFQQLVEEQANRLKEFDELTKLDVPYGYNPKMEGEEIMEIIKKVEEDYSYEKYNKMENEFEEMALSSQDYTIWQYWKENNTYSEFHDELSQLGRELTDRLYDKKSMKEISEAWKLFKEAKQKYDKYVKDFKEKLSKPEETGKKKKKEKQPDLFGFKAEMDKNERKKVISKLMQGYTLIDKKSSNFRRNFVYYNDNSWIYRKYANIDLQSYAPILEELEYTLSDLLHQVKRKIEDGKEKKAYLYKGLYDQARETLADFVKNLIPKLDKALEDAVKGRLKDSEIGVYIGELPVASQHYFLDVYDKIPKSCSKNINTFTIKSPKYYNDCTDQYGQHLWTSKKFAQDFPDSDSSNAMALYRHKRGSIEGGEVCFTRNNGCNIGTIAHELAHAVHLEYAYGDRNRDISLLYTRAITANHFVRDYARENEHEFFACCVEEYWNSQGYMEKYFPEEVKLVKKYMFTEKSDWDLKEWDIG